MSLPSIPRPQIPVNDGGAAASMGGPEGSSGGDIMTSYNKALDGIYEVTPKKWYEPHPYGFQFISRSYGNKRGKKQNAFANIPGKVTFYLPITPYNITTKTHFATNVITTLYGVVEEHSPVRYYDITISGTTGYSPEYHNPLQQKGDITPRGGPGARTAFDKFRTFGRETHDNSFLQAPFGIGAGALGAITQVVEAFNDVGRAFSDDPHSDTGIDPRVSGYVAFHNFYRFLLHYKRDAAGLGKSGFKKTNYHPLTFLNYKDGIKYDCIPLEFNLVRDASDPMVYNYSITLKAFNLRKTNGGKSGDFFLKNFLLQVGLAGSTTELEKMSSQLNTSIGAVSTLTSLF